jgi:tetratricopeptide (TPR) repeat protein
MGDGIYYDEVMRMQNELRSAIEIIAQKPADDSPVYTFLRGLRPPILELANTISAAGSGISVSPAAIAVSDQNATIVSLAVVAHQKSEDEAASGAPPADTISTLLQDAQTATEASNFAAACEKLAKAKLLAPRDPYITQKLAMATYKLELPTPIAALRAAESILQELARQDSTDTETLGLWGAIHKRLWELGADPADLETALAAHNKAFVMKQDYWNGINLALLYDERAAITTSADEAAADRVMANRTRRQVLAICEAVYPVAATLPLASRYWLLATMSEAWLGLGNQPKSQQLMEEAIQLNPPQWMTKSTAEQLSQLQKSLSPAPKGERKVNTETYPPLAPLIK